MFKNKLVIPISFTNKNFLIIIIVRKVLILLIVRVCETIFFCNI